MGLVEVFSLIRDIEKLYYLIEIGVSENLSLEKFSIEHANYPDECIRDAEMWALENFRQKIYSSHLRYSIVLLSYSILENQLQNMYRLFLKRKNLIERKPRKRPCESGLLHLKKCFMEYRVSPTPAWTGFKFLNRYFREVRNCIAHNGGKIKEKNSPLPLLEFDENMLSRSDSGFLLIEKEFLLKSFETLNTFFSELAFDYGFLIRNNKKEISITI